MRQSNLYMVIYAAVLTILCGGLLALAAEGLKDEQQANIALEQKMNILSTVMELKKGDDVEKIYSERVRGLVVDYQGNVKEGLAPGDVSVAAEYKKPGRERLLPVYEISSASNPDEIENIVLPLYGYGLWNNIWGFIALESDLNTVSGVKFQHAGETPGLGARIDSDEIQNRYKGKTIYEAGKLFSVMMMKGEGNDYTDDPHRVDGMSGATLTAQGVNNMLKDYLMSYSNYLKKKMEKNS